MKRYALAAISLMAFGSLAVQAAEAQRVDRGARANKAGGITAHQVHDREGPNGGTLRGGRKVVTDGNGNAAAGAVNCAKGDAGRACRAGVTTRTAEGEIAHRSGIKVEGANGRELTSPGGFTKDAEGNIDKNRTTEASGEKGAVTVEKGYATGEGRSRTVTCADASGAVVACPTR